MSLSDLPGDDWTTRVEVSAGEARQLDQVVGRELAPIVRMILVASSRPRVSWREV